jgi:hypothetical protein
MLSSSVRSSALIASSRMMNFGLRTTRVQDQDADADRPKSAGHAVQSRCRIVGQEPPRSLKHLPIATCQNSINSYLDE